MWTPEDIEFLTANYPSKGKHWCMEALGKSESQVRNTAAKLGLRLDHKGEFCVAFQKKRGLARAGIKRPEHSVVMKKKYAEGMTQITDWVKSNGDVISKAAKDRIAKNGHPRGMLGKKHTDEVKKMIGKKSASFWANKTLDEVGDWIMKGQKTKCANGTLVPTRNASWKASWRNIGGIDKYYRSRWEANYARYLQWLKENNQIQDWKHEPKTFWFEGIKRGCVSYLPDFWVQELNGSESYHEVKGWMDDRSKTKIKRMAIYHPDVKLIVIEKTGYKSIEKSMKGFILGWE